MSDQLKQLAQQYLEQSEREKTTKEKSLEKSNKLLPDLLEDVAENGKVTKFELRRINK